MRFRAMLVAVLFLPGVAFAHAMGDVFSLSLPFPYLALSAALALGYSFAAFTVFAEPESGRALRPTRDIGLIPSAAVVLLRLCFGALFVAALLSGAGLLPPSIAPDVFWLGLMLVGLYGSALIGGIADLLNPLERYVSLQHKAPPSMRYLPALVAYAAVIAVEILSGGAGSRPSVVLLMLSSYIFTSVIGASLWGTQWFSYGDLFGVLYGFAGRAAPVYFERHALKVPAFAARLVSEPAENFWALLFIVFMIASTSFDGLHGTKLWSSTFGASFTAGLIGLAAMTVLCLGLYLAAMQIMAAISGSSARLDVRFAYALIPIAIGYNVAHYCTLLTGPLPREAVWTVQLFAVLAGHVYGTYAAHRIALLEFRHEKNAALSHAPLLFLMMTFTVAALWILSLPQ